MKLALFFLVLIAATQATDWVKCAQTAIQLGADVAQLVKDAKTGDIQKIVADLQTILADVQGLIRDCGIKELTPEEIEIVEAQFAGLNTDWIQCGKAALKLVKDVQSLTAHAKTKDVKAIIQDLQNILADIKEIKANCGIKLEAVEETPNTDWIKCAQTAIKLVKDVKQLVDDAKTGDIAKIVQDLQALLADIQELKQNCGIKVLNMDNTDWIKCAQSAIKIAKDVAQLVTDAKTGDIAKIVQDLQAILADIQELKQNCGIKIIAQMDNTDWIKCAQTAIKLVKDVKQLVDDAKTGDIAKIVQDLQALLADIQELKQNCGIKLIDETDNTDWIKCAQSAIKIAKDVAQLVADAKTGDIAKIVQDLQAILADIQELKQNCGIKIIAEMDNTDWIKCAQSAIKLVKDVKQLVDDAKTGDIAKIVQDLQALLADIQELKQNCGIKLYNENTDWIKCAQSAIKIAKDVAQLVADAKTGDIAKIVQDLQAILADIQELKQNCGIKIIAQMDNTDWIKCAQAAIKLVKDVKQLADDAKKGDIAKIVQDLQALLADIQELKSNCGIKLIDQTDNTDWIKCAQSAIKIAKDVAQLVADAKTGDIAKIVQDLQAILADIQELKQNCGIKEPRRNLHKFFYLREPENENTDWIKCAQSAIKVAKDVSQLVADAKTGDIAKIVQDLQAILADIQEIKQNCGIKI